MEGSFDTEESFDDPSCLAPQPPGSVSPARRRVHQVKETKTTVRDFLIHLQLQRIPGCLRVFDFLSVNKSIHLLIFFPLWRWSSLGLAWAGLVPTWQTTDSSSVHVLARSDKQTVAKYARFWKVGGRNMRGDHVNSIGTPNLRRARQTTHSSCYPVNRRRCCLPSSWSSPPTVLESHHVRCRFHFTNAIFLEDWVRKSICLRL